MVGIDGERPFIGGDRFLDATHGTQNDRAVIRSVGIVRREFDRPVEFGQRLFVAPERIQCIAATDRRGVHRGIPGQHGVPLAQCVGGPAQAEQRMRQRIAHRGIARLD